MTVAPHVCDTHRRQEEVLTFTNQIVWKYVTGGSAAHAFLPGEEIPVCGEKALRGPDDVRRPPRWHPWGRGIDLWYGYGHIYGRHCHKRCSQLIQQRLVVIRTGSRHDS